MKKILITGAAGFIGYHLVARLLSDGHSVVGIDNLNAYYTPTLKLARLKELGIEALSAMEGEELQSKKFGSFRFIKGDIADRELLPEIFQQEKFDMVINLAAQAGVRYSLENPFAYAESNVVGFLNILECCRHYPVEHLLYASSSSVYGSNSKVPFSEQDEVSSPESLYAATKRSDELMASVYAKLYGIPTMGLRFFTVYGPWGRPDMAPMLFADAISRGERIKVFNGGNMERDFTYIDDIVEGIARVLVAPPTKMALTDRTPYTISDARSPLCSQSSSPSLSRRWAEKPSENLCPCRREMSYAHMPTPHFWSRGLVIAPQPHCTRV